MSVGTILLLKWRRIGQNSGNRGVSICSGLAIAGRTLLGVVPFLAMSLPFLGSHFGLDNENKDNSIFSLSDGGASGGAAPPCGKLRSHGQSN
jgi:hypothetical protein